MDITDEDRRNDVGYATHLEALAWALTCTEGDIVEAGAGWFSTPMLHGYCEGTGRLLVTVEPNEEWRARVQDYAASWHEITGEPISAVFERVQPQVVLVDGPPGPDRAEVVQWAKLLPDGTYVVVHDTDPVRMDMFPGLEDAMRGWAHERVFTTMEPWTTVLWSG